MHRPIVYPNALAQDADLLNTNKNVMVALGYALQAILGTGTLVDGLLCTQTTPATMSVNVGPGSIYSLAAIDASAYGSLPADALNQVVKQGIIVGGTNIACAAPAGAGNSVVYLLQAEYQDVDGGSVVLPYYNASNPSVPYSGPGNSGNPNYTVRQGNCVLSLKAGTPAATGSQATPTPDAGYVGLWAITVANGATTITGANIAPYAGAPFISTKLMGKLSAASNLADVVSAATALANLGGTPLNTTIKTVKPQFLSASGTYTPNPGFVFGLYFLLGGGGGGGGAYTTTSTTGTVGGGGSAAAMAFGILTSVQVGASQALTIGAGGAGGIGNNPGGNGGTSSLGSLATATGGVGGQSLGATSGNSTGGVGGGTASGATGILGIPGVAGQAGFTLYAGSGAYFSLGGGGADTLFGAGGISVNAASPSAHAGYAASGYGAGGGGAVATNYSASGQNGGAGSPGILVAIEFCTL